MGHLGVVLVACGLLVSCHSSHDREAREASRTKPDSAVPPSGDDADASAPRSEEPHDAVDADEADAKPCDEFAVDRYCRERPETCTFAERRKAVCLTTAEAEVPITTAPNACGGMTISKYTGYTSAVLHYDGSGVLVGLELSSDEASFCDSHSTRQGRDCRPLGTKVELCEML